MDDLGRGDLFMARESPTCKAAVALDERTDVTIKYTGFSSVMGAAYSPSASFASSKSCRMDYPSLVGPFWILKETNHLGLNTK